MEIIAYEMQYKGSSREESSIICVPFTEDHFELYKEIYNACFYEMRRDLEVTPYNFYSEFEQMKDKAKETFLFLDNGTIAGAVTCLGNEIDDLIVNKAYQGNGYGKQLLCWALKYMESKNRVPITLHVAAWNTKALKMYEQTGFVITKQERIR